MCNLCQAAKIQFDQLIDEAYDLFEKKKKEESEKLDRVFAACPEKQWRKV